MQLVVTVEIDNYGNTVDEDKEVLHQIRKTVVEVVKLCDLSVTTFVKTEIQDDE